MTSPSGFPGQAQADGPNAPVNDDQRASTYARHLLTSTQEELNRADTKASIAFAGTGGLIVLFIASALRQGWSPTTLSGLSERLWWLSSGVAFTAVVLLGAAVYPRRRRVGDGAPVIAFYGDVLRYPDPVLLRAKIRQSAADDLGQLVDQLLQVSRIVMRKYRLIALAMWALLVATLGGSLAVLLEQIHI
jgi:hypothetical protein